MAAVQREVRAALLARQAAAIQPRASRAEIGAIPVLRAKSALRSPGKLPEMVAAAAETATSGRGRTAQVRAQQLANAPAAPGYPDTGLDAMWNNYGDNAGCADWSGGDGTGSVNLGGGYAAWFFSDSFLGSPAARKTLFDASSLRNSIVIQQGSSLRTITGGNTCQEKNASITNFWDRYAKTPAPAPDAGSDGGFYWTGDQMVVGSNVVKFYYHGNQSVFPWAIDASAVATIPVSSLESSTTMTITPTQFTGLCGGGNTVIWGSALLAWGPDVYVYGWSTTNSKLLYLARTSAANLSQPSTWQSFAGLDSNGNPTWSCGQPAPLPITLGSGLSVSTVPGSNSLWLVQEDPGQGLVGGPIAAHPASEPWLFDNKEVVLYYPPQETHDFPYYYLTYGAQVQSALASTSQVVISYNVNTTSVDTGCVTANMHDASIYRPRFIDVPTSAFSTAALTTAAAPSGAGLPAPAFGLMDYGPTDAAAAPAVNAAGTKPPGGTGSIDGVTDWNDQWGSLAGGCPGFQPPSTLTVSPSTPDGEATLTWPTVGTDVWFWGYQADQTAGTAFAKTWGGLWAEPSSPTAKTVSALVAPVTSTATNGDTYEWYAAPFGAGGQPIGPVGVSPTAAEPITIQKPAPPTNLTGGNGSGAEAEFSLNFTDTTYPSSAVYYLVNYWDISANGNYTTASQFPVAFAAGTTAVDVEGLTKDNPSPFFNTLDEYGFDVQADNLAGPGPISTQVNVLPTPVCWAGNMDPAADGGAITFTAAGSVYLYAEDTDILDAIGSAMGVADPTTGVDEVSPLAPGKIEVYHFVETANPPVPWRLTYEINSQNPGITPYGTVTSADNSCR